VTDALIPRFDRYQIIPVYIHTPMDGIVLNVYEPTAEGEAPLYDFLIRDQHVDGGASGYLQFTQIPLHHYYYPESNTMGPDELYHLWEIAGDERDLLWFDRDDEIVNVSVELANHSYQRQDPPDQPSIPVGEPLPEKTQRSILQKLAEAIPAKPTEKLIQLMRGSKSASGLDPLLEQAKAQAPETVEDEQTRMLKVIRQTMLDKGIIQAEDKLSFVNGELHVEEASPADAMDPVKAIEQAIALQLIPGTFDEVVMSAPAIHEDDQEFIDTLSRAIYERCMQSFPEYLFSVAVEIKAGETGKVWVITVQIANQVGLSQVTLTTEPSDSGDDRQPWARALNAGAVLE